MERAEQYWTRYEQEQYSQRIDDENHRQNRRLGMLEDNYKQLTELTICVREQTSEMASIKHVIKEQGEKIDKIVNEPAKQWQKIKEKAIDTAVGIIVGALIVGIFVLISPYIK